MVCSAFLAAALGASSVILPASPEGMGIGDIDGDSGNELVVLLVWPSWSSMSVSSHPAPDLYEIEVKPAIEDRRELWAFRVDGGSLERVAAPLRVGREILAIAPLEPAGPVVVLDDDGVLRVVLDRSVPESPTLKLERIAALRPLVAGIASPLGNFPLLTRLRPGDPPKISVPLSRGLAWLDGRGGRLDLDSPFRDVTSGKSGSIRVSLPRRIDLERDGIVDLLYIDWTGLEAAIRRGAPDGSFAAPVVWDLRSLVRPDAATERKTGENAPPERELLDVLDVDGDGTLDAVIDIRPPEGEGVRDGLKRFRGVPGEYQLHPLATDGSVAKEPSTKIAIASGGIDTSFDHPEGWDSRFRDLDGDGQVELLTGTIDLGYLGIAKGLVTKKMKMGIALHVYRREGRAWREVSNATPKFEFTADLSDLDMSRFFRMPGDLDGDGREDMVQVSGRQIQIHKGLPGARFSDRPSGTLRLEEKVRGFFGLFFVDLDGDRRREVIAFEEQPQEKDQPARAVRMEVRSFEEAK